MFVTVEGPEGSGKSSAVAWLAAWFEARGAAVLATREPGGTVLGEAIRPLLLDSATPPSARAALLLFAAGRAEHVERVLRPALASGMLVICDRYTDSTLAYQGFGDQLPLEEVRLANRLATGGLEPDRTILLDLDPEVGLQRRRGSDGWNTFDARALEYHQRVRQGFLCLAAEEPDRWLIVDAGQPLETVRAALAARLLEDGRWKRTTQA